MTIAIDDLDEFISANFDSRADAVAQLAASPGTGSLQAIHDYRVGIREQQGELLGQLESHSRAPLRSEERKWEALDDRFTSAGELMDGALTERERIEADREHLENQRKPFNTAIFGGTHMKQDNELSNWIRHGGSPTFDIPLNTETHDTTKGGSAGAMVPLGFVGTFYMHLIASAGVRQTNAIVYRTSGGEPLVIPKSTVDPTAAIVAEGVAITPNDPTFSSVTLSANGYKALVYVSRELIEDSQIDVEEILGRLLGRAIGQANGVDLVTGNGTSKPLGVANSPVDGSVTTWALLVAGATGPDLLQDLFHSVNAPYRPQAYWMCADATLAALRKLKSTTNEYLIQRNLTADQPEQIFGRPVVTDPNFTSGAGTGTRILFGDFSSYYAIRDVGTVRLERSDDFRFANDEVAFRAVLRTDGRQVLNDTTNSAVKALRITA
jgi:HK97 family phage major capsid protein